MLNNIGQAIQVIRRISPNTPIQEVEKLAPILINKANQEPWYKSRVTWGAIASILTGSGTLLTMILGRDFDPERLYLAVGAIGGGILTLKGRWGAVKPIGE